MTSLEPPRSPEQRLRDTLDRLRDDQDAWVATASPDGIPCLAPLWFAWDGATLLMATRRTNPTAVNVTPTGEIRVTLGTPRDVVLIKGEAEIVEGTALPTDDGDAFAAKLGWDPRKSAPCVYLRITPHTVQAWREENEQPGRDLMRSGTWLVHPSSPATADRSALPS
ncbi:pyridoxamine 5'-phosphate oxidase family protein [Streptomyces cyaneofuscatus]|uniref:pyridoxamine 5'-phosphate oxidase family protein n=1 Tax=Streptomyces cyaneofuscatus TaxID=66883 RepID=UPI00364F63EF